MIEALLQAERLLLYGMLDQAEAIYSRTVEADPKNAIALVGLARVAAERGDEPLALRRSRAALAVDPQNEAARALERRLAEILAARGEPVGAGNRAPSPDAAPGDARRGRLARLLGRR